MLVAPAPSLDFALERGEPPVCQDACAYTPIGAPDAFRRVVSEPMRCSPSEQQQKRRQRVQSAGAGARVAVVAPGGGTGINSAVYAELGRDPTFAVDIVGRSRAPYDCYPEEWPDGGPAPNLRSFGEEVLRQGWAEQSDCFVFGSRGGQVVLPLLWERLGDRCPPAICMNGGCAMRLPRPVVWPAAAITFVLTGGEDYFRGHATVDQYVADTKGAVPPSNGSTAILFVNEMQHMPQAQLLHVIMPLMLRAILNWQRPSRTGAPAQPPLAEFRLILRALNRDGWSGRLLYTQGPGDWADVDFGPYHVSRHAAEAAVGSPHPSELVEVTRRDELRELLRAAALASRPNAGVPLAHAGARLHAAAVAAMAANQAPVPENAAAAAANAPRPVPVLPIAAVAAGAASGCPRPPGRGSGSMTPSSAMNGAPVTGAAGRAAPSPSLRFNGYCNSLPGSRRPSYDQTPISQALGIANGQPFFPSPGGTPYPNASPMSGSAAGGGSTRVRSNTHDFSPSAALAAAAAGGRSCVAADMSPALAARGFGMGPSPVAELLPVAELVPPVRS
eukprot:TRINITY_DN4978_c1_g1_i2.p1 TRINITY_DN4978_c1_g1~~TRINITY_DN4978_c1_g1_i2.p1  ORF type:complete len:559 (+),score=97.85 TRINITY_DN4978_c1_g1_i2:68-1744(+)